MRLTKVLTIIALLGIFSWLFSKQIFASKVTESMPIRYVRAEGVFQYLSKDEVKDVLTPLVMTSIFDADVQKIQAAVMQLPWVKHAEVERVWPDSIDIKVQERRAYVRWGDRGLLTENGELFMPKNLEPFQSLVMLEGPKEQEAKTLEIMKGVRTALADQALELAIFKINDRAAWTIRLTNGLEIILGRTEQLKKLQRFLNTLTVLGQEKLLAMQVVDLRYPNGYAATWKPDAQNMEWLQPKTVE